MPTMETFLQESLSQAQKRQSEGQARADAWYNAAKEEQLAAFELNNELLQSYFSRTPRTSFQCFETKVASCTKDLRNLSDISIRELTLGKVHKGRALPCRVATSCQVMASVMMIVEDGKGNIVNLAIYGTGITSRSQAEERFPKDNQAPKQGQRVMEDAPSRGPGVRGDAPIQGQGIKEDAPIQGQRVRDSQGLPEVVASLRAQCPDWTARQVYNAVKDMRGFQHVSFGVLHKIFQRQAKGDATAVSSTGKGEAPTARGSAVAAGFDPAGGALREHARRQAGSTAAPKERKHGKQEQEAGSARIRFEGSVVRDAQALEMFARGASAFQAGKLADAADHYRGAVMLAYTAWLLAGPGSDASAPGADASRSNMGAPTPEQSPARERSAAPPLLASAASHRDIRGKQVVHPGTQEAGASAGTSTGTVIGRGTGTGRRLPNKCDKGGSGCGSQPHVMGDNKGGALPVHTLYGALSTALLQGGCPAQALVYARRALEAALANATQQRADVSSYYNLQFLVLLRLRLHERASKLLASARVLFCPPPPPPRQPEGNGSHTPALDDPPQEKPKPSCGDLGTDMAAKLDCLDKELEQAIQDKKVLHVGRGDGQYRTITAALALPCRQAEILVHPGLYRETLVVARSVTIRNAAAGSYDHVADVGMSTAATQPPPPSLDPMLFFLEAGAVPDAGSLPPGVVCIVGDDAANTILVLAAPGEAPPTVVLQGLHVWATGVKRHALSVCGATVTAEGCDFLSKRFPALQVVQTAGALTLSGCAVHDSGQGGVLAAHDGYLAMDRTVVCRNAASGVEFRTGGQGDVQGCWISENFSGLLHWHSAGPVWVRETQIFSHEAESGVCCAAKGMVLQDCDIYGNRSGAVSQDRGELLMEGCRVHDSLTNGVTIQDTGSRVVQTCEIFANHDNGVLFGFDLTGKAHIRNTHLHDNSLLGIANGAKPGLGNVFLEGNREHGNFRRVGDPVAKAAWAATARSDPERYARNQQKHARRIKKLGWTDVSKDEHQGLFTAVMAEVLEEEVRSTLLCNACGMVEPTDKKFPVCARCHLARYCSTECQKVDWKAGHKEACCLPRAKFPAFDNPQRSVEDSGGVSSVSIPRLPDNLSESCKVM
eukprot:jgi/Mesvir1/7019/Mv09150-RA.1